MKYLIPILLILASLVAPVSCTVKSVKFNQDCSGYLKQAADANSADIALERLNLALDYIEHNRLTEGYTSVLWRTENENIGFWYQNLKACQKELTECADGTQLEKSNVLMKVRESLTDNSEKGTKLTIPPGIYLYPNNGAWMIYRLFSLVVLFVSVIWIMVLLDDEL